MLCSWKLLYFHRLVCCKNENMLIHEQLFEFHINVTLKAWLVHVTNILIFTKHNFRANNFIYSCCKRDCSLLRRHNLFENGFPCCVCWVKEAFCRKSIMNFFTSHSLSKYLIIHIQFLHVHINILTHHKY